MRINFEIVLKDQKSSSTMVTAPTPALPTISAGDVQIAGLPAGSLGVVQVKTASAGLRLVRPLPETNPVLKEHSWTRPEY